MGYYAESVLQAPAEERGVAGGHQDAGAVENFGSRDQGLEIAHGFAHGMSEEGHRRRVAGDARGALHYFRGALLDGVGKFAAAVVAVDFAATRGCRLRDRT